MGQRQKYNALTGKFDLIEDLSGITNPLLFKGEINANSDFPTSAEVENGWFYTIGTDVTDDDVTKTNTGLSFTDGQEIAWDGTTWIKVGANKAEDISYDNSVSGLTAVNVKTAIDEIQTVNPGIQFDITKDNPVHSEGKIFYDKTKKSLSYYNEESDVTVNIGQEVLFRVYNDTGATIPNGAIVTNTVTGLQLADNRYKDKANLIAMATHDIETGTFGYATRLGEVGGIDTSLCAAGTVVYLGIDGGYSQTKPDDGHYSVILGVCKTVSTTNGIIQFNPVTSQLTVEVTDTNGFPDTERTNTSMAFVDATRTFTISSSSYPFHFYQLGDKFEIESADSIVIDNTEGLHIIYYDEDVLTSVLNPTSSQIKNVIINYVIVAYIYRNATDNVSNYFAEERHGMNFPPEVHSYLHFTRGAQYSSGLGLGNFVIDDGDVNTHAQFSVASGEIADEDLSIEFDEILSTTGLPIYYLDGATGDLRRKTQAGFPVSTFDGTNTTRLEYNEWTGATWQLTEVSSNDFVLCHVFAINGYEGKDKQVSVIGQNEYGTRAQARAGASSEISNIILGFPFEEIVPIGTVIYQTNTLYDNDVNAKVVQDADGNDYIDWRSTELAQGTTATDHNNLTNLELAGIGVTWGHIDDQAQTIYGVKTFTNGVNANILNATSEIQFGGNNINTAGVLTNVAYLNQANTFTANQTINGDFTTTGAISGGSAAITGDLTVNTNTLYVDSTNSRVGIGTLLPEQKLNVIGGIQIGLVADDFYTSLSNNNLQFDRAGASYIDQEDATGSLNFRIDGSTKCSINNTEFNITNANVGIGITSPGALTHIYRNLASGDTSTPVCLIEQDNAGDDQPALSVQQDGTGPGIILNVGQDVEVMDFDACSDGGTGNTTVAGSLKVEMPNGATGYINFYT